MGKAKERAAGADSLLTWALGAAAAGAVLLVSMRFDAVFSAPKLAWAALAAAAGCWAVFFGGLLGTLPGRRCSLDAPLLAFFGAAAVSAAFSIDRPVSVLGHHGFYSYGLLAGAVYLGLYFAASSGLGSGGAPYFRAVALSSGLCALFGALQWAGLPVTMALEKALPEGRVYSTLGSPVYLGAVLALALPLCAGLWAGAGRDRALGLFAGAFCAAGLLLTQSRSAWLGAAAGLAVWAWASGRADGRRLLWPAAGLAAGLLALGLWSRASGAADSARVQLWKSAVAVAARRPLVGAGVGAFENAFRRERSEDFVRILGGKAGQASAHNDVLEVAATTGLVGLAAYLWCVWGLLGAVRGALADPETRADAAAAAGALAALFVAAKFNPTPFAALVAAAPLVGLLARFGARDAAPPSAFGRLAVAVVASVVCWGSMRLARADHWFLKARVYRDVGRTDLAPVAFDSSLRLNPYETRYRMATVGFLLDLAGRSPRPEDRAGLLAAAGRLSEEGLARRPGHVDSWQSRGVALARLAQSGDASAWGAASHALDRGLELDPWFPPLLASRGAVAREMGDAPALKRILARQARLVELTGGR